MGSEITILNNGGLVVIDGSISGRAWCIQLNNCQYIHLDGTGSPTDAYGFDLHDWSNAGIITQQVTDYVEINNVEIRDCSDLSGAGMRVYILVADSPVAIMHNTYIHDNFIHDVPSEAMYVGHGVTTVNQGNPGRPFENLDISNNICLNCGWDGIQVRNATMGTVEVYGNVCTNIGLTVLGTSQGGAGFIIGEDSIGRYHDNTIKNADRGFQALHHGADVEIDHNVFNVCGYFRTEGGGKVFTNGDGINIHHNTVISPADYGIETKNLDTDGTIQDHIIANPGGPYISSSYSVVSNNLQTVTVAENDFLDAANDDFHLTETSPARNFGHDGSDAGAFPYEAPPEPPVEAVGVVLVPEPSTIAPRWESKQLSAHLYRPTISSYEPRGSLVLDNLAELWTSYRHTKKRVGGYWDASITQRGRLDEIEDWLFRLGYHFECYNPALEQIFEGFVNRIRLQIGGFTVERGPLLDVVNKGYLVYSTVDPSTDPPTVGVRATSAVVEDADSQALYGIIEKYASAGGVSAGSVNDIITVYVAENARPRTGKRWNNREQVVPTATVELLGYVHFLKLYVFNDTTVTGDGLITLPDKIEDILGGDPNTLFSTDYSKIDPDGVNAQTIKRYNNENQTAWAQIKSITARGDGTDPWSFGIYNDRQAVYDILPSDWEYEQRLLDPAQRIFDYGGPEVAPWDVEPGKLMLATDFLIGKTPPTATPREDERTTITEQVSFIYPVFVDIVGGQFNTLSQRLATMGLSGIG